MSNQRGTNREYLKGIWQEQHSYSLGVKTTGKTTIYLAGVGAWEDETGKSLDGDFDGQTRAVFKQIRNTLEKAGATLDDIVTMTSDKGDLIIAGGQYVFTTAILDPESIKIYTKKLEFMIDETKKVALYKKGSIQPTTIATLKADVLKTISKLSSEIGQEYYPIQVDPPDRVSCNVGSRKKDRTNDVAGYTSKTGDVMVEGESMYTTLGHGFKEVCSVIDGDVLISGVNEKVFSKMAPLWIYYHGDNFEIGFYLAPRMAE